MRWQNEIHTCLPGQRFGRVVILREGERRNGKRIVWCRCECGTERELTVHGLRVGRTKSCGCYHREVSAKLGRTARLLHGESTHRGRRGSQEYNIWKGMRDRCSRPGNKSYRVYGARGITVCDRWRSSFLNFLADMGRRPTRLHSIERIDSNGNYERSNCRWATPVEQGNNTSRNRILEIDGERLTIAQWSMRSGIPSGHIWNRLHLGWSVQEAVFRPALTRQEACRQAQLIAGARRRTAFGAVGR